MSHNFLVGALLTAEGPKICSFVCCITAAEIGILQTSIFVAALFLSGTQEFALIIFNSFFVVTELVTLLLFLPCFDVNFGQIISLLLVSPVRNDGLSYQV
jgi:hypothetical protein